MAMNKDAGDNRTYVADQLTSFEWRLPQTSTPSQSHLATTKINWPGKLGRTTGGGGSDTTKLHVNLLCYASTITSDDAAVIQVSEASDLSSGVVSSNGHARGTSFDHAQIPGFHFAAISASTLGTNRLIYLRATHATHTSGIQQKYKFDS